MNQEEDKTSYDLSSLSQPTEMNVDILSFICQFFSLKELQETFSKISPMWCEAATKTEDRFWRDPNRIITFSNCMFDTKTGDVLLDLNQLDFAQLVFSQIIGKQDSKPAIIYTCIPFEFQNLDLVNTTKTNNNTTNASSSSPASTKEKKSEKSSSTSTTTSSFSSSSSSSNNGSFSDHEENMRRTHVYPVAPVDMSQELGFTQTHASFQYLHDGRFVFILMGNNLSCFDMISATQRWHINIYDKRTPKFMFVNFFTQNNKSIYIGLPQDVFCVDKARGTKFNVLAMVPQIESTMSKKKRERVKDLEVDDKLVVVVTGDNMVLNTKIDFADQHHYAKHHAYVMNEKVEKENETSTTATTKKSARDVSQLFQNHQLSRKKTLLNMGLDAPRLYLFDGDNNFMTSATCKNKDRHNILMKKSVNALHPYFCLINDAERELRVINKDGKRIHILNFPEKEVGEDIVNFAYQGKRFMLDGDFGSANWSLVHPESGRITDLSYLEVKHDRLFVVESSEGHLMGLLSLGVKAKRITYWEQEEQKAEPNQEKNKSGDQLIIRKFNMKWSTEMLWKDSFYKFEIDGACRFYYDKKRNYFIITRTVSDSRRFLSKEQRLDIEVSVFQSDTGKLAWKKQVECYTGNDPAGEKGFHIKTNSSQLFVMSYFIPVSPPVQKKAPQPTTSATTQRPTLSGLSYLRAFNLATGADDFQHKQKRKEDMYETVLLTVMSPKPPRLDLSNKSGSSRDMSQDSASSASDTSPRDNKKSSKKDKSKDKSRDKDKCMLQ